jgi:hypothetical protein
LGGGIAGILFLRDGGVLVHQNEAGGLEHLLQRPQAAHRAVVESKRDPHADIVEVLQARWRVIDDGKKCRRAFEQRKNPDEQPHRQYGCDETISRVV